MSSTAPRRAHWTRLSVILHWLIVILVLVQFLDHESMVALWDGTLDAKPIDPTDVTFGWVHIIAGSVILMSAAARLLDRIWRGRPPHSDREPNWATVVAKITHGLIYAILLVMPTAGLVAWFTGNDDIAGIHTFFWTPLLILIGLHVVGALAQHFYFKTDALRQIVRLEA